MHKPKGHFSAPLSASHAALRLSPPPALPRTLTQVPPVVMLAALLLILLTVAPLTGCVSSFKGEQAISIQKRGLLPQQEGARD
ncbi:hypothetical protein [Desulfovibrio psychrotolerans]|uniref:Uncharacterized protein n=1 Tax=Desulfovibrio psychrotolerans TaxID=415242 RepID=A0A7J0BS13_9BACT|nr:hypothetical protein [Desulfovibrio psychrotolerans]GFM36469.1 hypothetical protein DSM19430T_11530 [Desulfovibrio psychrotolerans]